MGQEHPWVIHPSAQGSAGHAVPSPPAGGRWTVDDLCRLTPADLHALYRTLPPAPMLMGRVKGRAFIRPGKALAVPMSRASRAVWQGKTIRPGETTAINRFFGLPMIRGNLYPGSSWLDGGPALILDYEGTSRIYAKNRDEMRQVAPGLILGLMYDRTKPEYGPTQYFALETE
jgi:hypothetical protein